MITHLRDPQIEEEEIDPNESSTTRQRVPLPIHRKMAAQHCSGLPRQFLSASDVTDLVTGFSVVLYNYPIIAK